MLNNQKVTDFRIVIFFFKQSMVAKHGCKNILPKSVNLAFTVVFIYAYVLSLACRFCLNKTFHFQSLYS